MVLFHYYLYCLFLSTASHLYTQYDLFNSHLTSKCFDQTSKENSKKDSIFHQITGRITISLVTGWPSVLADMTLLRNVRTTGLIRRLQAAMWPGVARRAVWPVLQSDKVS